MTLQYAQTNYQRLWREARARGEAFSVFAWKPRKTTIELCDKVRFYKAMNQNKVYRKKRLWIRALRKRLYNKLKSIKSRCRNPGCHKYEYYGGRGIQCLLSLDDLEFLWHRDNAVALKEPSIDRIDNNGHYERANCRFIEMRENRHRRKMGV